MVSPVLKYPASTLPSLHPVPIWFGFFFLHTLATPHGLQCGTEGFKKKISKNNNSPWWFPYSKKGNFLCTSTL
jgi:hypothetical protein